jgi:hypothetical protein
MSGCSGTLQFATTSGYITDGSGTQNYANNLNCMWVIAPRATLLSEYTSPVITFSFSEFSTESTLDTVRNFGLRIFVVLCLRAVQVRIYRGTSQSSSNLVATLSGSGVPGPVSVSGTSALIVFNTDSAGTSSGWALTYSFSNGTRFPTALTMRL